MMIALSVGASPLAHGVHYGVVGIGLLGLLVLLGPQWVGAPRNVAPRDEHERRVADLQHRIASGALGTTTLNAPAPAYAVRDLAAALIPIMVVGSTAAAGVHAAMGPVHLRELFVFGLFFVVSAIAQLGWSIAMVLSPSRRLLVVGIVGNAAILVLWLVTRTVGLPFGLMPSPEAIGPWDLCCGAWEAVVIGAGLTLLHREPAAPLRFRGYDHWPAPARLWLVGSILTLGVLTMSGAGG